ncbi:hypothetical protein RB597_004652 [Gaeumannomyces tritici]
MRFLAHAVATLAAAPSAAHAKAALLPRAVLSAVDAATPLFSPPADVPVVAVGGQDAAAWTVLVAGPGVTQTVPVSGPAVTSTVLVSGPTITRTVAGSSDTITRTVAGSVDTMTAYRTVVANTTATGPDPDSSFGFFVGTKTVTAPAEIVTAVLAVTKTKDGSSSRDNRLTAVASTSGSWCCLEGWRPKEEWVGDRHMVANVWTRGWGDERDGCHKGMLDNLHGLRGSLNMVWKCRVDARGGGGARAQFSFVTVRGSKPVTDIIRRASPNGADEGVECRLGCPPEQLWDWTKSEWL